MKILSTVIRIVISLCFYTLWVVFYGIDIDVISLVSDIEKKSYITGVISCILATITCIYIIDKFSPREPELEPVHYIRDGNKISYGKDITDKSNLQNKIDTLYTNYDKASPVNCEIEIIHNKCDIVEKNDSDILNKINIIQENMDELNVNMMSINDELNKVNKCDDICKKKKSKKNKKKKSADNKS